MIKSLIQSTALLISVLAISACSSVELKPWDRGVLAKPAMTFGGDSMIESTEDHIHFAKEATSGGRGVGAGGCGCN